MIAKKQEDLIASATDAEPDKGRFGMEEAILATLARTPKGHAFRGVFFHAYRNNPDFISRSDLQAVAEVFSALLCEHDGTTDEQLTRDELGRREKTVKDEVLKAILAGTAAKSEDVAEAYIGKLNNMDLFRRAEAFGREYDSSVKAAKDAKNADGISAAIGDLAKRVFDLATRKKLVREHPTEEVDAAGFLEQLASRGTDGREYIGLETGILHLDEVFNGLPTGLYILAGAPSTGKTTLAKQIADQVAEKEQVPVLFYSFEQSKEELRIKSLARLSKTDSKTIQKGRVPGGVWEKVETAETEYRRLGRTLTIIEAGRTDNVDAIRAAALMAKRKNGDKPVLLVIDYLQIIPAGPHSPDSLRERVDGHLSELRRLARDLQSPILVISSENRDAYKSKKKPTLAALKESGGIEYSADGVIILWRNADESKVMEEDRRNRKGQPDLPATERVEAFVLKNRNGELAKIGLNFTKAWATFVSYDKKPLDWWPEDSTTA